MSKDDCVHDSTEEQRQERKGKRIATHTPFAVMGRFARAKISQAERAKRAGLPEPASRVRKAGKIEITHGGISDDRILTPKQAAPVFGKAAAEFVKKGKPREAGTLARKAAHYAHKAEGKDDDERQMTHGSCDSVSVTDQSLSDVNRRNAEFYGR